MPERKLFSPVLALLLQNRRLAVILSLTAILQAGLVWAGLPGWPCPVAHTLGIPCPGCGLSRATVAFLRGDWHAAFALHLYAPVFVLVLALCASASLLPARPRATLVNTVAAVERRTGLGAALTVGLVVYWLARLLFAPDAMLRLVRG
jgi:hypothetical protein